MCSPKRLQVSKSIDHCPNGQHLRGILVSNFSHKKFDLKFSVIVYFAHSGRSSTSSPLCVIVIVSIFLVCQNLLKIKKMPVLFPICALLSDLLCSRFLPVSSCTTVLHYTTVQLPAGYSLCGATGSQLASTAGKNRASDLCTNLAQLSLWEKSWMVFSWKNSAKVLGEFTEKIINFQMLHFPLNSTK